MDERMQNGVGASQPVHMTPAQSSHQQVTGAPAKDYLGLSIFTLLCCFWPLGVIAIIKSVEVRRHNDSGMYDDASKASKQASLFVKIGILIGSISWAVALIFIVIVIVANAVAAAATVQAAAE